MLLAVLILAYLSTLDEDVSVYLEGFHGEPLFFPHTVIAIDYLDQVKKQYLPILLAGIKKIIHEEYPNGCSHILLTHLPEFGRIFHPPKVLDIMSTEWERAGYNHYRFA